MSNVPLSPCVRSSSWWRSGLGVGLINSEVVAAQPAWIPWMVFFGAVLVSLAVIFVDHLVPRKQLETISAVYFGLIVGMFLTYVVQLR